jgi:hypothetical protein
MEYSNVGLYEEDNDSSTTNDYFSFQTWVYEGSNVIEYHYGPNAILNNEYLTRNNVGLYKVAFCGDSLYRSISIEGASNSENPVYFNDINLSDYYYSNQSYTGLPSDGTVYRFTPGNLGLSENKTQANFVVYPNPANQSSTLKISSKEKFETFEIFNLTGQSIASGKLENNTLLVSNISQGNYFLTLKNNNSIATEKLSVH